MNSAAAPAPVLRPAMVAEGAVFSFVVDGREAFQQSWAVREDAVVALLDSFYEDPAVGVVPRNAAAVDAVSLATHLMEALA